MIDARRAHEGARNEGPPSYWKGFRPQWRESVPGRFVAMIAGGWYQATRKEWMVSGRHEWIIEAIAP